MSTNQTPDPNAAASQPTLPDPPPARKPIPTVMIAVYALIGIIAVFALSSIGRLFTASRTMPKSQQAVSPTTPDPRQIRSFAADQADDIARLQKEQREAAEQLRQAAQQTEQLRNGLPGAKCSPQLAGIKSSAPDGSPFVCGLDGSWHPDVPQDAAGVPAMTPQQQRVMAGPPLTQAQSDALEEAKRKRAEKQKREKDALSSSSIAVDFTADNAKPTAAETSSRSAATEEIPHPIDLSDAADVRLTQLSGASGTAKKVKYNWNQFEGKTYRIFEGTVLETVLTNRVNGALAGPIDVMVATDVYSHDRQAMLIPQGTRCLGTVSAVNSTDQQRLFVAFHRCIMPDGYSLDLDKFEGLNQIGETGLRDLVNHHYVSIFGASLAVGAIGGLAQIGNANTGFGVSPSSEFRAGIAESESQESLHILDRFLNQLPTFIVRERSRVRIYLSGDLEVPAYDAHRIDPTL